MRFAVLATDYDGTLAAGGIVAPPTSSIASRRIALQVLTAAFCVDYVVLGGGNAKRFKRQIRGRASATTWRPSAADSGSGTCRMYRHCPQRITTRARCRFKPAGA
jgi:hypothetical protein